MPSGHCFRKKNGLPYSCRTRKAYLVRTSSSERSAPNTPVDEYKVGDIPAQHGGRMAYRLDENDHGSPLFTRTSSWPPCFSLKALANARTDSRSLTSRCMTWAGQGTPGARRARDKRETSCREFLDMVYFLELNEHSDLVCTVYTTHVPCAGI